MQKTVNGIVTLFAYDEAGHLIGEYSGTGSPIQETIYRGDLPVAVLKGSTKYYVHADYRNAPRQIDDVNRAAVWTWTPLPFGESAAIANPIPYNLRYPGQYYDAESGLFYNGFRDYDPVAGQYIESDPIGLGGGVNTYAYVGGNPLSLTDPTGEAAIPFPLPFPLPEIPAPPPVAAVGAAGLAGYGLGTLIYPYIEPTITRMVQACDGENSREECKR